MPFGDKPRSGAGDTTSASSFPVSRALGITVLAALVILWALRHIYGSISIEAGAR
jgi:hypothetical protein